MKNLRAKAAVAVATCAVALTTVGVGGASAGEIKGTYKNPNKGELEYIFGSDDAPLKARSHCAYSGLDEPDELEPSDGDDFLFGQTQNFGQVVKAFGPMGKGGASFGCNPNAEFEED